MKNMKIALLCVGDELLKGATINTNLAYLGNKLLENGLLIDFSIELKDGGDDIIDALDEALKRADVVLTSGGLGPTADDMTKEYIARRLKMPLEEDGGTVFAIRKYWKTRHCGEPTGRVLNQSLVPKGATVIPNRNGTAPGLILTTPADDPYPGKTIIMMPGPPGEIRPMFESDVLPFLLEKSEQRSHTKMFYVCGIGESEIEERMLPVIARTHPLSVAYCATHEFVKLFLNSSDMDILSHVVTQVRDEFGDLLLMDGSTGPAYDTVKQLRRMGLTLATAESCTGGLAAKMITDVPGASDVFMGSVVSYANRIKESALGVKSTTLEDFGAVSRETALEMVNGIAERFGVDCAISLTGIAGPGGGTPDKPVGLVYCGVKCCDKTEILEFRLTRSREQIRERAAAKALDHLRRMLLKMC